MNSHPTMRLDLSKVVAGDGFAHNLELPGVSDLVHLIRTGQKVNTPIVVRKRDFRVVSGEDVVAAHVVVGSFDIDAIPVDLDEAEFVALRVADEARIRMTRDVTNAAVEALVDAVEARTNPIEKTGVRRSPKSQRTAARELVAGLLGVSAEALRKQDDRRKVPKVDRPKVEPWALDCYGNVATAELLEQSSRIRTMLASVDQALRNAQGNLTRVEDTRLGHERFTRLHESLRQLASLARSMQPVALCPYCKDIAAVRATCGACWGGGYVVGTELEAAPAELRDHKCVSYGGQFVDPLKLKPFAFPKPALNEAYAAPTFDDAAPDYQDTDTSTPAIDPLDEDW